MKGVTPALTFKCLEPSDLLCDFMTKLLLLSMTNKVTVNSSEIKFLFLGNSSSTLHTDVWSCSLAGPGWGARVAMTLWRRRLSHESKPHFRNLHSVALHIGDEIAEYHKQKLIHLIILHTEEVHIEKEPTANLSIQDITVILNDHPLIYQS